MGSEAAAPYAKLGAPVHPVLLGAPPDADTKEGKMSAEVPARGGRGGGSGARLDVKTVFRPAWRARST